MDQLKKRVDSRINSKKVVLISKRSCGFCAMAKECLRKYVGKGKEVSSSDYEVWEIGGENDCNAIQTYLARITGAKTVPRVFINGKCIGGWTETSQLHRSGQLRKMLTE